MSDTIGEAYRIATELEERGYKQVDAAEVLAMALGIVAEGDQLGHGDLHLLTDAMTKAAQITFNALRAARDRRGTA